MIEYLHNFEWNGVLALLLYWLPLALCAYGYTVRTWVNYQKDVIFRDSEKMRDFYVPTDRLGDILGRVFLTVTPGANLITAVFDVAPDVFRQFFDWLARIFNTPLVKPRSKG